MPRVSEEDSGTGAAGPSLNAKEKKAAKTLQDMFGGPEKVPIDACERVVHQIVLACYGGVDAREVQPNSLRGEE